MAIFTQCLPIEDMCTLRLIFDPCPGGKAKMTRWVGADRGPIFARNVSFDRSFVPHSECLFIRLALAGYVISHPQKGGELTQSVADSLSITHRTLCRLFSPTCAFLTGIFAFGLNYYFPVAKRTRGGSKRGTEWEKKRRKSGRLSLSISRSVCLLCRTFLRRSLSTIYVHLRGDGGGGVAACPACVREARDCLPL